MKIITQNNLMTDMSRRQHIRTLKTNNEQALRTLNYALQDFRRKKHEYHIIN